MGRVGPDNRPFPAPEFVRLYIYRRKGGGTGAVRPARPGRAVQRRLRVRGMKMRTKSGDSSASSIAVASLDAWAGVTTVMARL